MKTNFAICVSRIGSAVFLMASLGGCGIPDSMHVRMGGEPRYEDDDVLFRATYYFRVFDFCAEQGQGARPSIKSDALYRFKMTGKGKSSFNQVRFESGTLHAWQIDPLGASVEFDKGSGKPYFVSQQKREEMLKQNKLFDEISRLRALKEEMLCKSATGALADQCNIVDEKIKNNLNLLGAGEVASPETIARSAVRVLQDVAAVILPQSGASDGGAAVDAVLGVLNKKKAAIESARGMIHLKIALADTKAYVEGLSNNSGTLALLTTLPSKTAGDDATDKKYLEEVAGVFGKLILDLSERNTPFAHDKTTTSNLICGSGLPARRGFQTLGPEGWRTFDQDERLVLAMSSTGKPLLDALRDVSSRMMARQTQGLSKEVSLEGYLAVAQARAKMGDIGTAKPDEVAKALDAVIESFNKKEGE